MVPLLPSPLPRYYTEYVILARARDAQFLRQCRRHLLNMGARMLTLSHDSYSWPTNNWQQSTKFSGRGGLELGNCTPLLQVTLMSVLKVI